MPLPPLGSLSVSGGTTLRIALLAMNEPAGAGFPAPRAFLRVGGVTVARHQLAVAIALDCQRIVCIARMVGTELLAIQHDAEAAGLQFHVVPDARGLAKLVTASDEVVVLSDGLLADPAVAGRLLGDGAVVLVQPVEEGLAAGFERIDLNQATAGAMRLPGRFVDGLAELPADCDILSALTRIALQGGAKTREIAADVRGSPRWRLVRDDAEARSLEEDWLRLHLGRRLAPTPGHELARLAVQGLGPTLLHAGHASRWLFASAGLLIAMTLIVAWFRLTWPGFVLLAIASVLGIAGEMLRRIEAGVSSKPDATLSPHIPIGWTLDATIVVLAIQDQPLQAWESLADRAFPAVALMLVARLLSRSLPSNLAAWVEDRPGLFAILAVSAAFGLLAPALQLLTVALALVGILLAGARRG